MEPPGWGNSLEVLQLNSVIETTSPHTANVRKIDLPIPKRRVTLLAGAVLHRHRARKGDRKGVVPRDLHIRHAERQGAVGQADVVAHQVRTMGGDRTGPSDPLSVFLPDLPVLLPMCGRAEQHGAQQGSDRELSHIPLTLCHSPEANMTRLFAPDRD